MIEKTIYDYLTTELSPVPVHMERPTEPTGSYVLVMKTGSGENNTLKSATIAVQSYADSLYNTALLNETVKAKMLKIIELDSVSSCSLDTDYQHNDVTTKAYRYQAVFTINHY